MCHTRPVFNPQPDGTLKVTWEEKTTVVFPDWDDKVAMVPVPNADREVLELAISTWWPTLEILWPEDLEVVKGSFRGLERFKKGET